MKILARRLKLPRITFLATGVLLWIGFVCGGCLSRPHLESQSFSFATAPRSSTRASAEAPVLSIRRLQVDPPFDGQSFLYRTGELSYERDPYAGFLVPPAESLAEPLKTYFRQSGFFRDVVEPGSALEPDVLVEISVEQLYGDFRSRAKPASFLRIHFRFIRAAKANSNGLLLNKDYSQSVALKARTAAAVMAGWNKGLGEILRQVSNDFKASAGQG